MLTVNSMLWKNCHSRYLNFIRLSLLFIRKFESKTSVSKLRNIGIIAHIDAGKTTLTERALYLSGQSRHLGEVDKGDTVTDFMEQERKRGITISTAAVSFNWRGHSINLMDTPGHIDFGSEVERAVRVLDAAVTVLDGCRGVEAQTRTVWRQAAKYQLPQVVFVNKLDRFGANLNMTVDSLRSELGVQHALLLQHPLAGVVGENACLTPSLADLVEARVLCWNLRQAADGSVLQQLPLPEHVLPLRLSLLEKLADLDDGFAELFLYCTGSPATQISGKDVRACLRRLTQSGLVVPVLCGSAKRNWGVQPLLDFVVQFFPDPLERHKGFLTAWSRANTNNNKCLNLSDPKLTCALAFKTINDPQRVAGSEPLTLLRLYSGSLSVTAANGTGQFLWNATRGGRVRIHKLYKVNANEIIALRRERGSSDMDAAIVGPGELVAANGLADCFAGDVLVSSEEAAQRLSDLEFTNEECVMWPVNASAFTFCEPVVFASIEVANSAQLRPLQVALEALQREDPSFRAECNTETGQTVVKGAGDLHLEVLTDRLRSEYKIEARLGKVQIAYREGLRYPLPSSRYVIEGRNNNKVVQLAVELELLPMMDSQASHDMNESSFDDIREEQKSFEFELVKSADFHWDQVSERCVRALYKGLQRGLLAGPLLRSPVHYLKVRLHRVEIDNLPLSDAGSLLNRKFEPLLSSAASTALRNQLRDASPHGMALLEPWMRLQLNVDSSSCALSAVIAELVKRRALIRNVSECSASLFGTEQVLVALAPLDELVGFSKTLRGLCSGKANMSMHLERYRPMAIEMQDRAVKKIKYAWLG